MSNLSFWSITGFKAVVSVCLKLPLVICFYYLTFGLFFSCYFLHYLHIVCIKCVLCPM